MDQNNIHLEIANALLNERQLANEISQALYNALESLDAHLMRIIQFEIDNAEYYDGDLQSIKSYIHERIHKLQVFAGIYDFNPKGCTGEQTYKFIQQITQIHSVDTDPIDNILDADYNNYTQAEFNALTEEDDEDYYTEKGYHEFTASGGCRD